jgi:uncharacterized coiled-coil protein SlyX
MSSKYVLEEQLHKLESEVAADEAWINYIDGEVREQNDKTRSVMARLDEIEAKMDDFVRILEREFGSR